MLKYKQYGAHFELDVLHTIDKDLDEENRHLIIEETRAAKEYTDAAREHQLNTNLRKVRYATISAYNSKSTTPKNG